MPGSLVAVVERLDDEIFKSLQVLPGALQGMLSPQEVLVSAPSQPSCTATPPGNDATARHHAARCQ